MVQRKRRVYVAGAYSSDNVLGVLRNMRRGMRLATEAFQSKIILPFAPWFDYHFFLMEDDDKPQLTIQDIYEYSISFLENWAEAVLVQPIGWNESTGTVNEINMAQKLGIPVFFTMETLAKWIKDQDAADAVSKMTQEAQDRGEYNVSEKKG